MITWLRIAIGAIVLLAVTLLLLPFQLLGLRFNWKIRRFLPRLWHRVACRVLGIRVRVHGVLEAKRPLLLAANHASWKDILVLGSVADVVYIAKSEVRGWPVFGILARLQATIFVEREQRQKTGEKVNEIAERLAAGEIVVLFPEGTTSDGNRLLEVKSSLFGAAASAVPHAPDGIVHIQPVSIAYTGLHGMAMGRYHRPIAAWPGDIELMPHLMGILRAGAVDVDVDFGERVDYTRTSNRKAVSRTVEARIRAMLGARLRGR
ncbi:1-acyl-sn-glycerol-3-phosphate acyltransferase [Shinella sumterensis]|uniref:lysophospholipid acyltransferase family protein n=1 Tax=Shinella sumterensis TaxID=1967501 RepID=UPI00106DEB54|nr:lysophospholipid acyltransferase family protein [Shinella sumterensis]MCD1264909.1 1-acyl-sn-glycerol-3-phosphate acyltransferase [Shinella sumterensis]TFE99241.1 1-acyl-sn-glycerol-3-phosphate acyltransferase [Shinella sumterensis]